MNGFPNNSGIVWPMVLGGYAAVRHDAAGTDALLSCRLVAIRPA